MNPASMMFPVFSVIIFMIGMNRGLEDGGFTQKDGIGLAIGLGLGAIVTVVSHRMNKATIRDKAKGAALSTSLFGSMMIKFGGAGVIFGLAYMLKDEEGALIFDINVAFSSYLAIVFLGFAMLPKLVQAPTRLGEKETSEEVNEDDTRAEESAQKAQN